MGKVQAGYKIKWYCREWQEGAITLFCVQRFIYNPTIN